jgi:hypothetical protein
MPESKKDIIATRQIEVGFSPDLPGLLTRWLLPSGRVVITVLEIQDVPKYIALVSQQYADWLAGRISFNECVSIADGVTAIMDPVLADRLGYEKK